MKATAITEENISGFYGLLDKYWTERTPERFFMGALDDDDEAVAAASCALLGRELAIQFFAVEPSRQEEGIGREFIIELAAYAFSQGFDRVSAYYYNTGNLDGWEAFLKDAGFTVEPSALIRKTYPISDIMNVHGDNMSRMPEGYQIKSAGDLNDQDRKFLRSYFDAAEKKGIFMDVDELQSDSNTLGGALLFGTELRAAAYAAIEGEKIRLGSLLLRVKGKDEICYLMDHILLKAMSQRVQPEYICYEYGDSKEDNAFLKINEKTGIEPCDETVCTIAYIDREEL